MVSPSNVALPECGPVKSETKLLVVPTSRTSVPSPPPSILPARLPVEVTVKTLFWLAAPTRLAKPPNDTAPTSPDPAPSIVQLLSVVGRKGVPPPPRPRGARPANRPGTAPPHGPPR